MTKNQYEHNGIFVEEVQQPDGSIGLGLTAVAFDLTPEQPVTIRHLSQDEATEFPDMPAYVEGAKDSVDKINDRMVDQVIQSCHSIGGAIPHFGFIDLVHQFQAAPHLLLANMLASMICACAEADWVVEAANQGIGQPPVQVGPPTQFS